MDNKEWTVGHQWETGKVRIACIVCADVYVSRDCDVIVHAVTDVQGEGIEVDSGREGVRVGTVWRIVESN